MEPDTSPPPALPENFQILADDLVQEARAFGRQYRMLPDGTLVSRDWLNKFEERIARSEALGELEERPLRLRFLELVKRWSGRKD